jgi:hypothetical protein
MREIPYDLLVTVCIGDDREMVNMRLGKLDNPPSRYSCCFSKDGSVIGTWDAQGRTDSVLGRVLYHSHRYRGGTGEDGIGPWQNPHGMSFQAGDIIEFTDADIVTLLGELETA